MPSSSEEPKKREQIVNAATKLFAKYGPRKTTIDEIAQEAGIGKGTVYLYFSSKEEVFTAAAQGEIDRQLRKLRSEVRKKIGALNKLKAFLACRLSLTVELIEGYGTTREIVMESTSFGDGNNLRLAFFREEVTILRDILEEGVEGREFREMDCERTAIVMTYMMQGLDFPIQIEGKDVAVSQRIDVFVDLVHRGIGKT